MPNSEAKERSEALPYLKQKTEMPKVLHTWW